MATFTRLKLDDSSDTWLEVNLDQVNYVEPRGKFTTIHFSGGDKVDVKETGTEIMNQHTHTPTRA